MESPGGIHVGSLRLRGVLNREKFFHVHFVPGRAQQDARLRHTERRRLSHRLVYGHVHLSLTVAGEFDGRVVGDVLEICLDQIEGLRVNSLRGKFKMAVRIGDGRGHLLHALARLEEKHLGAARGTVCRPVDHSPFDHRLRGERCGRRQQENRGTAD